MDCDAIVLIKHKSSFYVLVHKTYVQNQTNICLYSNKSHLLAECENFVLGGGGGGTHTWLACLHTQMCVSSEL